MASTWIQSEIKLSIGILVSNRIDTIRNCMDSLVPLLKELPSELIVLDTVGEATDGSADVAREYTDKVYRYEWCQNFADARNTCLKHATGEWFLFLDDDEWFDHVDDLLHFFKTDECETYCVGVFTIRNHIKDGQYVPTIAQRLIRRKTDTHFVGRIHETYNEAFPPVKHFESFLHHTGYLYTDPEKEKKHKERNVSLLRAELQEKGWTPISCAQLVQELLYDEETAKEGFDNCMEYILYFVKAGKGTHSAVQWMMTASVRYFLVHKTHEEALEQERYIRENFALSRMAAMVLAGVGVEAAVKGDGMEEILQQAERFAEHRSWLKKHPEEAIVQLQLDFSKYYEDVYAAEILQAGAKAANALQQQEKAYEFWQQFPWDAKEVTVINYREALLETLRGMKNKTPLVEYYKHFYREELFLPENRGCLPKECRMALEDK